jgi:hypothetical protein
MADAVTDLEPIPQPEHHPGPYLDPHAETLTKPPAVFSGLSFGIREEIVSFLPTPDMGFTCGLPFNGSLSFSTPYSQSDYDCI